MREEAFSSVIIKIGLNGYLLDIAYSSMIL
jgi:hypothetical protein